MSTRTLFWALKQNPGNQLDKLAIIFIADQANDKADWSALIAMEDLAVFCQASIRRTRDAVRRLEAAELLRFRDTKITDQAGRTGWKRFYPLHPECPLLAGQLGEIDWTEPEELLAREIKNFVQRTERASDWRHNSGKGARPRPSNAPELGTVDESDVAETSGSEGTRTERPGTASEPGTRTESPGLYPDAASDGSRTQRPGTDPDAKSGHSYMPPLPLIPPSSRASPQTKKSSEPGNGDHGRKREEQPLEPQDWALAVINGINFGSHRRPSRDETRDLALLVQAAVAEHHLSQRAIKHHCRAVVNESTSHPISYLRGGLHPNRLPEPQHEQKRSGPSTAPKTRGEAASDAHRQQAMDDIRRQRHKKSAREQHPSARQHTAPNATPRKTASS